ncbi:MAG: aminotransferase class V-fold PLP-dependent enzyme [Planctomycetota bacterium]
MTARRLYLDNAATTFPKPRSVHDAMAKYATDLGASPGRGSYAESLEGARIIRRCRERLNTLINGESPDHVVFTLNTSDALNLAIKGLVTHRRRRLAEKNEDRPVHVVATDMDHNSVLRPLNALAADPLGPRVTFTRVKADAQTGLVDPGAIRDAITRDTVLVAIVHASNVTGSLQPADKIGQVCREMGVPLLLDAAQTAGRLPIDVQRDAIDLLAIPGHKALLGPLGTAALYIRPGLEDQIVTQREGGTGTVSEEDVHPSTMPDKYEPGSHNTVGIAGLSEGLAWLLERTVDVVRNDEVALSTRILSSLKNTQAFPGLRLLGPTDPDRPEQRVGVFTFSHQSLDPHEMATLLETEFNILSRAGIHCAPHAHNTMGTIDRGGSLRISLGPFVTPQDIEYTLNALSTLCTQTASV